MNHKLPVSLGKSPIIDALIEIRFITSLFKNAVFGVIYNEIRSDYPGAVVQLPILQIPEQIRDQDPNLKFKPTYRIENEKYVIQIGSDVLSIGCKVPYVGWDEFYNHSKLIINRLITKNIIGTVTRLGVRYINFFDNNEMLNNCNISLSISNYDFSNTLIRSEIKKDGFVSTLQFSDNARYKPNPILAEKVGSLIDIDTSKQYYDASFQQNIDSELLGAHKCEKELFFSLLKDHFISSLNPIYNE